MPVAYLVWNSTLRNSGNDNAGNREAKVHGQWG